MNPLADDIRPKNLDEVVGQKHILSKDKILYKLINSKNIRNMIFYGPPGTGKSTVAKIAAGKSGMPFYKLNATNASLSDIKNITLELDNLENRNGILLYLDEIQNFNKKQQQSLLDFIENGRITLIAATTENPFFSIYNAILSRCTIFQFKMVEPSEIFLSLKRAVKYLEEKYGFKVKVDEDTLMYIAKVSSGDVRKALNSLETAFLSSTEVQGIKEISLQEADEASGLKLVSYDKNGDNHYDLLSAFQKSIRGSDPDASIYYLARLIETGDLLSITRRLLVIASEDVGLAYPQAISIVKACTDAALQVGLPEGRINLAEAVLTLATAPKSNSVILAIDKAISDVKSRGSLEIPNHLSDTHYAGAFKLKKGEGYKFPHNYKNNYVFEEYLPKELKNEKYYVPQDNKFENKIDVYIKYLKNTKSELK